MSNNAVHRLSARFIAGAICALMLFAATLVVVGLVWAAESKDGAFSDDAISDVLSSEQEGSEGAADAEDEKSSAPDEKEAESEESGEQLESPADEPAVPAQQEESSEGSSDEQKPQEPESSGQVKEPAETPSEETVKPDAPKSKSKESDDKDDDKKKEDKDYSLRLLVKAAKSAIREDDVVLGDRGGVYLLGFANEKAIKAAESYYGRAATWCERDIAVGVSANEAPSGNPDPVGEDDNALALLEEAEAEGAAVVSGGKLLVALVDTGAPVDSAVVDSATFVDENPRDAHGHAAAMLKTMKGEDAGVRVLALKALDDSGKGSASSVYAAIEYAISAGADVINLSLAGRATEGNEAIAQAVKDALAQGITVVASAGNGGYDAGSFTPANVPGVITVGACDKDGHPLESSNRGEAVDFYVAADSTSAAAARVAGWLSANGVADGWQDRLAAEDWAFTGIEAASSELDEEIGESIGAAYANYNYLRAYHIDTISMKTQQTGTFSNPTYFSKANGLAYSNTNLSTQVTSRNVNNSTVMSSTRKMTFRGGYALTRNTTGSEMSGYNHTANGTNGVWTNIDTTYRIISSISNNTVTFDSAGLQGAMANAWDRSGGNGYGYARDNNDNYYGFVMLWEPTVYKITLNDNGGTGGSGTVYEAYYAGIYRDYDGTNYSSEMSTSSNPVTVPTKANAVFHGYYTSQTGGTQMIDRNGRLTSSFTDHQFTSNTTLYARWIKVTLDDNGGTGGNGYIYPVNSTGVYRDAALTQSMSSSSNPVPVPTRGGGYVFQGYYPSATSNNNQRFDRNGYYKGNNKTFAIGSDTTLYAQWVRISLDDTGGSGGNGYIYWVAGEGAYRDANLTQKTTTTSNALPVPTRSGYVFDGYYPSASSTSNQRVNKDGYLTSNSTSTWTSYAGDVTLYARWNVAPWRITLDKQGATNGEDEVWLMNSGTQAGLWHEIGMISAVDASNPINVPSKSYQTFQGYYTQPYRQGTQMVVQAGTRNTNSGHFTNTAFTSDATIYAAWEGIAITLNLASGSRNGGPATVYEFYNENWNTNRYGSTPVTSITPPTRTNYTFMGYFTGQNGSGTQIIDSSGTFVAPTTQFRDATTLYAYWAPENYVITLDPQGADTGLEGTPLVYSVYNQGIYTDIAFTQAVSTTKPITVPQRSGYAFQGYYTLQRTSATATRGTQCIKPDGTLTTYFSNTRFRTATTLYAQWKVAPHTVYLDDQGGTGGSGQVYEMASVGVALDYAMTQKVGYTGSSGAKNPVRKPTKPYQTFNGYYVQQYGKGTRLLTNGGFRTSSFNGYYFSYDATIYAYWTGYRIVLNRQGGSGGPAQMYSFYNEKYASDVRGEPATVITSITPPKRSSYTFMGYYTQQNGAGTQVIDGTGNIVAPTTFFTSTATLYAYWAPENYTITLDNNGADVGFEGSDAVYALYGTGVYSDPTFASSSIMNNTTNPITIPQKTGKVFRGYRTGEDSYGNGSGTMRIDNDGYVRFSATTYKQDVTLHARWLDAPFVISLDDQGGTGGSGQVYELYTDGVYFDQACKKLMASNAYPVTKPTLTDRVFAGYWTEPNGGGTIKINERGYRQSFPNTFFTSDDTIYAFWRGYAITLNDQGGRNGSGTIYEHYGVDFFADMRETTSIAQVVVPTRTNYDFRGYYTGKNGTGTRLIDESGNYENVMTNTYYTTDTTLYAYWTPKTYEIKLDNQNADAGYEGSDAVYESYGVGVYREKQLANVMTQTLNPIDVPRKQFAKFGGYYTQPNGRGVKRINALGFKENSFASTSYNDDATLYAYWMPLTITLDDQGGSGGSGAIYEEYGVAFWRNQNLTAQMVANSNRVAQPTLFNHRFMGYYTQPRGQGVRIIDANGGLATTADPTFFTDDDTIYAYWEFHLDLPITGGTGLNDWVLWGAVFAIACGGGMVLRRRLVAVPAGAPRRGSHARAGTGAAAHAKAAVRGKLVAHARAASHARPGAHSARYRPTPRKRPRHGRK